MIVESCRSKLKTGDLCKFIENCVGQTFVKIATLKFKHAELFLILHAGKLVHVVNVNYMSLFQSLGGQKRS